MRDLFQSSDWLLGGTGLRYSVPATLMFPLRRGFDLPARFSTHSVFMNGRRRERGENGVGMGCDRGFDRSRRAMSARTLLFSSDVVLGSDRAGIYVQTSVTNQTAGN